MSLLAETDEVLYNKLMKEFKSSELLSRQNREKSSTSNTENITANEVFINDREAVVI